MPPRQHGLRWERMAERVHRGAGKLEPERRAWAHDPELAPEFAKALVAKLQGKAADIADEDVRALAEAGLDEDQIFEFLVSGAVYAGTRRLDAGLAALHLDSEH